MHGAICDCRATADTAIVDAPDGVLQDWCSKLAVSVVSRFAVHVRSAAAPVLTTSERRACGWRVLLGHGTDVCESYLRVCLGFANLRVGISVLTQLRKISCGTSVFARTTDEHMVCLSREICGTEGKSFSLAVCLILGFKCTSSNLAILPGRSRQDGKIATLMQLSAPST